MLTTRLFYLKSFIEFISKIKLAKYPFKRYLMSTIICAKSYFVREDIILVVVCA